MPARLSSMDISEDPALVPSGSLQSRGDLTDRRRSGRATRKPEHFTPQISDGGRAKRKRAQPEAIGQETDGGITSSGDESVESAHRDSDEENYEAKKKKRRASVQKVQSRPIAKKSRSAGATKNVLPLRTASTKPSAKPSAKPRRTRKNQSSAATDAEGLYGELFSSGHTVDAVAAEWISRYEQNNTEAMRDLVNFVLRASGCDFTVTVDDIEDHDNVTGRLGDLQDEYQAQGITEYPLISRARSNPPFRLTLSGFFTSLIATANASAILYTDFALIENIQLWVTTMSSSAIRPFRHTATVISLSVLSCLCDVAAELIHSLATTRRQLEAEEKKARVNKGRVGALEESASEKSQKNEVVEGVIKDIFDTVFVHRYRDVDPRIRVECVQALGYWCQTLPDVFFDGSYLRYLGWLLSDTHAPTRLEVVKQLQKLYKNKNNVGGLRTFTERFRSRLVEMATRDADQTVRAATVELLEAIRAIGLLEPEDIDTIGRLLFDSEARVRKSVTGFFVETLNDLYESRVEELGGEEELEELIARESGEVADSPNLSWLKLKCLVDTLQAYDTEDDDPSSRHVDHTASSAGDLLVAVERDSRFSLATQALYDMVPEVRDWDTLSGYLLYDHSEVTSASSAHQHGSVGESLKDACRLSDRAEIILLDILNMAVRLSLAQPDDAEAAKKGKKKKAAKVNSLEDHESTALRLAQLIPKLLNKFGAVPAATSAVLRLEHVLDLEVFQQLRQDSTSYPALLDDINKQFVSHSNEAVLAEASAALLHARGYEDLKDITEEKLQQLWEDTVSVLQTIAEDETISSGEGIPMASLTDLSNAVRKVSNLASISDCVGPLEGLYASKMNGDEADSLKTPLQLLLDLMDMSVLDEGESHAEDSGTLEEELLLSAMKSILFYFMWRLKGIKEEMSEAGHVKDSEVEDLRRRRDAFIVKLVNIIQRRTNDNNLRQSATGTLLDLHTLLSTLRNAQTNAQPTNHAGADQAGALRSLVSVIATDHQLLVTAVYKKAEGFFAKKTGRSLEAADDDDPIDDELDSDSEDEDTEEAAVERAKMVLIYEQRLCELAGKIVLAIVAGVLDASGPLRGKMRERLNKNRGRLGPNFKEVVAYLDGPKTKKSKKETTAAKAKKDHARSTERVILSDDENNGEEEQEEHVEEGGEEDLRSRELHIDNHDEDDDEGDPLSGHGGDVASRDEAQDD